MNLLTAQARRLISDVIAHLDKL